VSGRIQALAEIHVLEPNRPEGFIKTADAFKNIAPYQQKSSGRLIYNASCLEIVVEAPVLPVDAIAPPQPVYAQSHKSQRQPCGEPPDGESRLRQAIDANELARRGPVPVRGGKQRSEAVQKDHVGVQQKDMWSRAGTYALVHRSRKTTVLDVLNDGNAVRLP